MPEGVDDLVLRPATGVDEEQILALASRSLGWGPEPRWAELFRWKHDRNAFGTSLRWVAMDAGRVVGFRAFLRWEFVDTGGRVRRAVRAVDTATDPDYRGRGIFRRLTLSALDHLAAKGVDFVFNTPNDQSRPGYLKMGWAVVGRPAVMALPTGPSGLVRLAGARTAAELWSEPCAAGTDAAEALAAPGAVQLVDLLGPPTGLTTNRTLGFLRWRYGFEELRYRALALGSDVADGLAVFRLRRRGSATEATVTELLVPHGANAGRRRRRLLRRVAARSGADYVLVGHDRSLLATPAVGVPGVGPTLTWRGVDEQQAPLLSGWTLTMGDLELF